MGRQSRKHRERRENKGLIGFACPNCDDLEQVGRIAKLQDEITDLAEEEATFRVSPVCSADAWESNLDDIRAFEAVGSGISLFVGLQMHGLNLPPPEQLTESESAEKVSEVLQALEDLRIFLVGFERMTPCEFYSTLWHQTLWEGCYVRKRDPGAITLIDVSHRLPRSKIVQFLDKLMKGSTIH